MGAAKSRTDTLSRKIRLCIPLEMNSLLGCEVRESVSSFLATVTSWCDKPAANATAPISYPLITPRQEDSTISPPHSTPKKPANELRIAG